MCMNLVIRSSLASSELSVQDDHLCPKEISLGEGIHQGTSDGRNLGSWRCTFWVVQQGYHLGPSGNHTQDGILMVLLP